jgi:hypothetical protein
MVIHLEKGGKAYSEYGTDFESSENEIDCTPTENTFKCCLKAVNVSSSAWVCLRRYTIYLWFIDLQIPFNLN